jgi:uncharacterized protein YecE (DUF72 family)
MTSGRIRAGMGGWNYEPWHDTFYPKDVTKAKELSYASRQVTAIEINGTFYRLQKPDVFRKWHDETPDDFVFTIKAPRYIVQRKALMESKEFLPRFLASGLSQLKAKLGPILWQLPPITHFDRADLDAFMKLLPRDIDGVPARHAFEVRHSSFRTPELVALAREHNVAIVFADSDEHPSFADVTGDFVYGRLMRTLKTEPTGYSKAALASWAERAKSWASGGEPTDLPTLQGERAKSQPRDVFLFFISGAKERAPLAAQHLLALLGEKPEEHPPPVATPAEPKKPAQARAPSKSTKGKSADA